MVYRTRRAAEAKTHTTVIALFIGWLLLLLFFLLADVYTWFVLGMIVAILGNIKFLVTREERPTTPVMAASRLLMGGIVLAWLLSERGAL